MSGSKVSKIWDKEINGWGWVKNNDNWFEWYQGLMPDVKQQLENQQNRCYYCGDDLTQFPSRLIQLDHKIPVSGGGTDEDANLCVACSYCNQTRKDKTAEEFKSFLKPYQLGLVGKKELSEYNRFKKSFQKWIDVFNKESDLLQKEGL